jgi:hypothetical protein
MKLGNKGSVKNRKRFNNIRVIIRLYYKFSHNEENFGTDPDDEALLSLSWAGKNNKLFNFVDDIVEGLV